VSEGRARAKPVRTRPERAERTQPPPGGEDGSSVRERSVSCVVRAYDGAMATTKKAKKTQRSKGTTAAVAAKKGAVAKENALAKKSAAAKKGAVPKKGAVARAATAKKGSAAKKASTAKKGSAAPKRGLAKKGAPPKNSAVPKKQAPAKKSAVPKKQAAAVVKNAGRRPDKTPVRRRRDALGHLDPAYAADLLSQSEKQTDDDRAFLGGKARSSDDLAEELGEQFVGAATSGEDSREDSFNEDVPEERGGPFVPSTGGAEFAEGTDASNPIDAKREPFPRT
jgi:hypothetical protein